MKPDHAWVSRTPQGVLVVQFPESPSIEELHEYQRATNVFMDAVASPFAYVVDGTHVIASNSAQRKVLSEGLTRNDAVLQEFCRGMAIAVKDVLLRGVTRAIWWVAPPQYPHQVFDSLSGAHAWAQAQLSIETSSTP